MKKKDRIAEGSKDKEIWFRKGMAGNNTVETEAVLRIRDVYPGSDFFHSGSWIQGWQDPGSGSATKNFSIFNAKNLYWVLKNRIRNVHPGSRILAPDFFPSRIQGPNSTCRIPDSDPQHWTEKKKKEQARKGYRNSYFSVSNPVRMDPHWFVSPGSRSSRTEFIN